MKKVALEKEGMEGFFRLCKVLPKLKKGCRRPTGLKTSGAGTLALTPQHCLLFFCLGVIFILSGFSMGQRTWEREHGYSHGSFVIYPYNSWFKSKGGVFILRFRMENLRWRHWLDSLTLWGTPDEYLVAKWVLWLAAPQDLVIRIFLQRRDSILPRRRNEGAVEAQRKDSATLSCVTSPPMKCCSPAQLPTRENLHYSAHFPPAHS